MGAGKILVIIGALLSIVGTYVFALFTPAPGWIGSGIGFAVNLPELFANADLLAALVGMEVFIVYIIIVVFIIFLAAGVFQLLGAKSRALGFVGSLFALGVFVYFMLIEFSVISSTAIYAVLFSGFSPNALGPLPLHVQTGTFVGLGTYLLAAGAVLGFIGTFVGRD